MVFTRPTTIRWCVEADDWAQARIVPFNDPSRGLSLEAFEEKRCSTLQSYGERPYPDESSKVQVDIFGYQTVSGVKMKFSYLKTTAKECIGPSKCGKNNVCVGFEDSKVFCYGSSSGCLWGQNDCSTDEQCKQKYSTSSPKYTDGVMVCEGPGKLAEGWRADACTCSPAMTNEDDYGVVYPGALQLSN